MFLATAPGILLLFAAGLVAGFVDSIAGGGGLISLPVLVATGMPVRVVLGTNKLQASFGSCSAALHYARHGIVDLRQAWLGIAMTALGAILGTWMVERTAPQLLQWIVPFLLLAAALYMIFKPDLDDRERQPQFSRAGVLSSAAWPWDSTTASSGRVWDRSGRLRSRVSLASTSPVPRATPRS